jgi:hypothetical protein
VLRQQSGLLQEQESALVELKMLHLFRMTALVLKAEGVYKALFGELEIYQRMGVSQRIGDLSENSQNSLFERIKI